VLAPGLSGTAPGLTHSVAWSFASARIADAQNVERSIEGNGAHGWGDYEPQATYLHLLVPSTVSLHMGSGLWDGGVHAGWRSFAATTRRQLVTLGPGQTTSLALALAKDWAGVGFNGSLAFEQTVPLEGSMQALLRTGLGAGRRELAIRMPEDLDPTIHNDNTVGAAHLDLYRDDLRFEAVAALAWSQATVSFQPYLVLAHGRPRDVGCTRCSARLLEFKESFGFAVALSLRGLPW